MVIIMKLINVKISKISNSKVLWFSPSTSFLTLQSLLKALSPHCSIFVLLSQTASHTTALYFVPSEESYTTCYHKLTLISRIYSAQQRKTLSTDIIPDVTEIRQSGMDCITTAKEAKLNYFSIV